MRGTPRGTAWYPLRRGIPYGTVVDALADSPLAPAGGDRAGGQVFSFGDDAHGKLGHGASAAELAAAAGGVPQSSDADDVKHEVRVGYTSMACLGRQLRWRTPSAPTGPLAACRARPLPCTRTETRTTDPSTAVTASHPSPLCTRARTHAPRMGAVADDAGAEAHAAALAHAAPDRRARVARDRRDQRGPRPLRRRRRRRPAVRPLHWTAAPTRASEQCALAVLERRQAAAAGRTPVRARACVRACGLAPQVCVGRERARAARVRRPDGPRGADARRGRRAVQHARSLGRAGGR